MATKKACPEKIVPLLGYRLDREIAEMAGVHVMTARKWRLDRGVPPRCKRCGEPHSGGCADKMEAGDAWLRTSQPSLHELRVQAEQWQAEADRAWDRCVQIMAELEEA